MVKGKVLERLDLLAEFYEQFNCRNKKHEKRVRFFKIESIDKPNVITIALNPKEYYERFINHSDNKKHKGLKKTTPGMDFDSYSSRLCDLIEYINKFSNKPTAEKIEEKRFQVINESTQMKSISKIPFGQLNDKRFYFSNGIISLPYGNPYLEKLRKKKHKYRGIHKVIKTKKNKFLNEESKVIKKIPRLDILKQIFGQMRILYELDSDTKFLSSGWKTTKEFIKNGRWK